MINTEKFIDSLLSWGFEEFVGVPCSYLKPIINYTTNLNRYVAAANEGDAVAYAFGASLSGKKVAVLMQNSGLSNALSPLTSLNAIYAVPIFMLIGYRGGDADEPQHRLMGKITCELLELIETKYKYISLAKNIIDDIENTYKYQNKNLVYLIEKGDLSDVSLNSTNEPYIAELTRNDVLNAVNSLRDENTIVITTTGFISREMHDKYENDKNFYMVGSMGCAISIGNGLAKHRPDQKVIVVDGDGSFLMRLSGALLSYETNAKNLIHIIIDNGLYESTGGQFTVSEKIDISNIASSLYGTERINANTKEELETILKEYIKNIGSTYKIQNLVCKVTKKNDNNLGRPKKSCQEQLDVFKKALKDSR